MTPAAEPASSQSDKRVPGPVTRALGRAGRGAILGSSVSARPGAPRESRGPAPPHNKSARPPPGPPAAAVAPAPPKARAGGRAPGALSPTLTDGRGARPGQAGGRAGRPGPGVLSQLGPPAGAGRAATPGAWRLAPPRAAAEPLRS